MNVRLKDTVEIFTKRLYYLLFDEQEGDYKFLEEKFLEMTNKLSYKNGSELWKKFKNSIPTIRKRLFLDAKAFQDNDPANKCLEIGRAHV